MPVACDQSVKHCIQGGESGCHIEEIVVRNQREGQSQYEEEIESLPSIVICGLQQIHDQGEHADAGAEAIILSPENNVACVCPYEGRDNGCCLVL